MFIMFWANFIIVFKTHKISLVYVLISFLPFTIPLYYLFFNISFYHESFSPIINFIGVLLFYSLSGTIIGFAINKKLIKILNR